MSCRFTGINDAETLAKQRSEEIKDAVREVLKEFFSSTAVESTSILETIIQQQTKGA